MACSSKIELINKDKPFAFLCWRSSRKPRLQPPRNVLEKCGSVRFTVLMTLRRTRLGLSFVGPQTVSQRLTSSKKELKDAGTMADRNGRDVPVAALNGWRWDQFTIIPDAARPDEGRVAGGTTKQDHVPARAHRIWEDEQC
jgi:hypothetical protein